ncbi:ribonuclease HI [Spirochaeta lutea]|uniref:Ribonuclease H n=1 Tax=Spirochaeta lutea TaxID=1480694 RepID=A0A098QSC1_9SPIO|nr:ribonuclease HI [Spirochaeta lutea]KGE70664.1 ribonuclease H [Spirochaeta lutea]
MIEVFSDGGCIGNPGPGGWAYIVSLNNEITENYGAEPQTTNNKMELTAVIEALRFIRAQGKEDSEIIITTDSQYVKNGITTWIHSWKKNGWRTAAKQPVKNRELWEALDALAEGITISWRWVKGHSGNPMNERCDELVHVGINSLK